MSITNDPLPAAPEWSPAPPAPSPRRIGQPLLAWLVIAGVVAFILIRAAFYRPRDSSAILVALQLEGRYLVGVNALNLVPGKQLFEQSRSSLEQGPYRQRLRVAILAGELVGPEEAVRRLEQLEADRAAGRVTGDNPEAVANVAILRKLYVGYVKGQKDPLPVPAEDQARLRTTGLGWFGDLALAPPGGDEAARAAVIGPAKRSVIALFVMLGVGVIALGLGLITAIVLGVLALIGRLGSGMRTGSGHGGVYAETFALYMVLFLGLSWLLRFLPLEGAPGMLVSGLAMVGSPAALAWPVLRGISWRQVREDIGLTVGPRPDKEVAAGIGSYLCALPLLLVAILVMYGLMMLQRQLTGHDARKPGEGPSHPIAGVALARDPWLWVVVVLLAVVLAPIVEEIMFRGVLYRHLRESTRRAPVWLSIAFAVLATGFVFAVIHPQGWLGVPPLMALATVFALTREWRGSLVAPMIAHGINNGVSTTFLFLMAG